MNLGTFFITKNGIITRRGDEIYAAIPEVYERLFNLFNDH